EDGLWAVGGGCGRREQPADAQVRLAASLLRDQRIGGFLHTIMDEPVGACQALDAFLTAGRPQRRVDLLLRRPEDTRKPRDLTDVAPPPHLLHPLLPV